MKKEQYIKFYSDMLKIRRFEEEAGKLFQKGNIHGAIHLYIGEESVATGICNNLKKDDYITSTHRGHGHCIAKGADLKLMMAELMGKKSGYCHGKGGSMHIADFNLGIIGANGIVGGGMPIAVGAALYSKNIARNDSIAVCFFGDGASNEGSFHESLNFASIRKLPVLFVCENNKYAVSTPCSYSVPTKHIYERAKAYDIEGTLVNGSEVLTVFNESNKLIRKIRNGEGPKFIECETYRWEGHYLGDPQLYKTEKEQKYYKNDKDPIKLYKKYLKDKNLITVDELNKINLELEKELKDAIEFANESPYPDNKDIFTDIYA